MVAAACVAAHQAEHGAAADADARHASAAASVVRQLWLAAAKQDAAAAAAAVQHKLLSAPLHHFRLIMISCQNCSKAALRLSCVWLDLWLEVDAERAALEASWLAVQQQMLSSIAKARHEQQQQQHDATAGA